MFRPCTSSVEGDYLHDELWTRGNNANSWASNFSHVKWGNKPKPHIETFSSYIPCVFVKVWPKATSLKSRSIHYIFMPGKLASSPPNTVSSPVPIVQAEQWGPLMSFFLLWGAYLGTSYEDSVMADFHLSFLHPSSCLEELLVIALLATFEDVILVSPCIAWCGGGKSMFRV